MIELAPRHGWTLLTGSTGMVGHVLLSNLLRMGHRCVVLLRSPMQTNQARLSTLLAGLGLHLPELVDTGKLVLVEGALPDCLPTTIDTLRALPIARIVHAAASVRFSDAYAAHTIQTNDLGTQRLLEWADALSVDEFHFVSTAFVCGCGEEPFPETVRAQPACFRNVYEQSKWQAEQHVWRWAKLRGTSATIYRPSIVVGAHTTGRISSFTGVYLAFRAFDVISRAIGTDTKLRQRLPLRLEGSDQCRLNLIPVDYLGSLLADIISTPELHQRVYNIVHTEPVQTPWLAQTIEQYFGLVGSRFVQPSELQTDRMGKLENSFYAATRHIRPYFVNTPAFIRTNTAAAEKRFNRPCPLWDEQAIHRLLAYGQQHAWGRRMNQTSQPSQPSHTQTPAALIENYFTKFFSPRIAQSTIATMDSLNTTIRFAIHDIHNSNWVCCFERGQLVQLARQKPDDTIDFTFRMNMQAFWDMARARTDPQTLFLSGQAEIEGDTESALKMGMLLCQFLEQNPYPAQTETRENALPETTKNETQNTCQPAQASQVRAQGTTITNGACDA